MNINKKEFKILSIDGGGYRGIYAAHILKRMEEELGINWTKDFQLITGTSTGSIIAAGLASGLSASKIFKMYKNEGRKIFSPRRMLWLFKSLGMFTSKYKRENLQPVLVSLFENKKLGDISFPLIIPATDIANGCVHVFKSTFHDEFFRDKNILISDAVLASCSAPTYFSPSFINESDKRYLLADGGLWANNPSLVATIDAKKRLGASLDDVKVLSIGTGESKSFYPISEYKKLKLRGWGFAGRWGGSKFIEMILNLQSQNANNMLGLLLAKEQILRINFQSDIKLPLDKFDEIDDLLTRADFSFTHEAIKLKTFIHSNNKEK